MKFFKCQFSKDHSILKKRINDTLNFKPAAIRKTKFQTVKFKSILFNCVQKLREYM